MEMTKTSPTRVVSRYLSRTAANNVRYEWGREGGVYHSSVYAGDEMIGTIGLKWVDRDDLSSRCRDDLTWVIEEMEYDLGITDYDIQKWEVFDVNLQPEYWGKGIGSQMYQNIFKITNGKKAVIIIGSKCFGNTTSSQAQAVYERLGKKYVSKGLVVGSMRK